MDQAIKIQLPTHKVDLPAPAELPLRQVEDEASQRGEPTSPVCPNREVGRAEEDVGLISAACPACGAPFVYSFKAKSWIPEGEFENTLARNPPDIRGI